ncbi:MAG: methyltransferase family protein [Gemmatimonadales bacterium]
MALREELERSGAWLFRYRSWAPPIVLILLVLVGASTRPGTAGLSSVGLVVGLSAAAIGLLLRGWVIGHAPPGTSGKNRAGQVAESLNTTGPYSVVRHPLYLANYLLWLGPALALWTWWPPVLISLVFALYYERIMFVEEEFLRRTFGPRYLEWAAHTPAFVPDLSRWQPAALPFSLRIVLRQEYYAWFSTVALFVLLEVGIQFVNTGRVVLSSPWIALLLVTAVIAGVLRALQRYTKVLHVEGR